MVFMASKRVLWRRLSAGSLIALAGCASLSPTRDVQTYPKLNCSEIKQEIEAVTNNQKAHESNKDIGVLDVLGIFAESFGTVYGRQDIAYQGRQAQESAVKDRDYNAERADSYSRRLTLLNEVSAIRKCQ